MTFDISHSHCEDAEVRMLVLFLKKFSLLEVQLMCIVYILFHVLVLCLPIFCVYAIFVPMITYRILYFSIISSHHQAMQRQSKECG